MREMVPRPKKVFLFFIYSYIRLEGYLDGKEEEVEEEAE